MALTKYNFSNAYLVCELLSFIYNNFHNVCQKFFEMTIMNFFFEDKNHFSFRYAPDHRCFLEHCDRSGDTFDTEWIEFAIPQRFFQNIFFKELVNFWQFFKNSSFKKGI